MVNNRRDLNDDNAGRAPSSRLSVANRAISRSMRRSRRSDDYMVLSVPVRSDGDDGIIVPENNVGIRLDGFLQTQQRLERHITHLRNEQARLNNRIASPNQYLVSMETIIRRMRRTECSHNLALPRFLVPLCSPRWSCPRLWSSLRCDIRHE